MTHLGRIPVVLLPNTIYVLRGCSKHSEEAPPKIVVIEVFTLPIFIPSLSPRIKLIQEFPLTRPLSVTHVTNLDHFSLLDPSKPVVQLHHKFSNYSRQVS